ncbi:DgyrCDS14003 [Dimorphilus gyrociliatus]|uniref:DgyrCDS14003 n=1 Tax=Dimorphilus gyrociliatus TaxID=2664684 RepID=A0A7I8WCK1_9ANNE|nr:DgyrCDS14003 [Dimorphilus gyrociliatus]
MASIIWHVLTNKEFWESAQIEQNLAKHSKCDSDVTLEGKVAIVTGGTAGIGKECVRDFVKRGAKVIIPCREMKKGEAVKLEIENDTCSFGKIILMNMDLSSMESVRKFAKQFRKREDRLDILLNNGGIINALKSHTKDGFESILATNSLSHFLLTHLLFDLLKKSSPSRVVNVSSSGHYAATDMMFDDFQIFQGCWKPSDFYLYCRSKAANVMYAVEWQRRHPNSGVTFYSCHPGAVRTEIFRNYNLSNEFIGFLMYKTLDCWNPLLKHGKTPVQGAQTPIYCCIQRGLESQAGLYFTECEVSEMSTLAQNIEVREKLWNITRETLNI